MTDLDAYWPPTPPDDMALERKPKVCRRHQFVTTTLTILVTDDEGNPLPSPSETKCVRCGKVYNPIASRRGKSSRRLGHDGERRSEKRYGWRKVGEYGGITDLEGTLAVVQQKTSRRAPPAAWLSIFRALEARSGGRIPLVLLSFVRAGVDTEDLIVIRGRDWLQLHGLDEPGGTP